MSRYRFELATPADDAELRAILAATPMAGEVAVAFGREPSFFAAAGVEGGFHQTIVGRDVQTSRIMGFGSRSIRTRYVNGTPMPIGYLSALRVLPQYRSLGLVARGYARFRELHADGRTPLYLTTIAQGNDTALSILTSGRAGLPRYLPAGRFHTLVLPTAALRQRRSSTDNVEVRTAEPADLPELLAFLQQHGPTRQFFPVYESADFGPAAATFRGLDWRHIGLAHRNGRLVGVLAAWDQRPFKQVTIHSYSRPLGWARPCYNLAAAALRWPKLPRVGEGFPFITGAMPLVEDDDPKVAAALLGLHAGSAPGAEQPFLLIGLHERDPLLPAFQGRQVKCYVTLLYYVGWEDAEALRAGLDARPPYLELGCL